MLVQLYKIMFTICIQTLIPNREQFPSLPPHQVQYIFAGAIQECYTKLEPQRMAACSESPDLCKEP